MNEDLKRWDDSAEEWVKHFESKQQFKPALVNLGLAELMPEVKDISILDAGCGDGIYSKQFFDAGAIVTAIDGPSMIAIAKEKNPGPNYVAADLMQSLPFTENTFDFVFSSMVLMQLSEISTFLNESKRVLKDSGALIIITSHPSFTEPAMSLYKSIWAKITFQNPIGLIRNYYQGTAKARSWSKGPATDRKFYPRTLETYSKELKKAGFVIEQLFEPHELSKEFLQKYPKYEYATRLPRFLFIKAIKT